MRSFANRRMLFLAIALALVAAVATTGMLAYLTSESGVVNRFNLAYNTVEVVEEFDPPAELSPNSSFTKKVQVENTGTGDCYVRVFAEFADSDAQAFATIMYGGSQGFNVVDWSLNAQDGYWYYSKALAPGEITAPLFDSVAIGSDESLIESFDILVYAESVQSSGYADQSAAWAAFS